MKFSINRAELINILSDYSSILKDHPVKPIISGLCMKAYSNQITFIGTSLEVNLIKKADANITTEGECVFNPGLVLEYIKLLDHTELEISLEDNRLVIYKADFAVMDKEEFPVIKEIEGDTSASIIGKEAIELLDKVKFSAALSGDNPTLACVRMVLRENEINFVSTDSYRLAFIKKDHECVKDLEISLPIETVSILCKLLKNSEEEIIIGAKDNNVIFTWKNSYFSSRTIELPFPNYKGILGNSSFQKSMEFNTPELKSALKKVMTVAKTNEDTKFGALFDFKDSILVISSVGRAKISQKVSMIKEGDNFKASLNTKYLYEFVDNISKNTIIRGNGSSAMFEIREHNNNNYIYILMPLALRD